jgi:hypothetical protein
MCAGDRTLNHLPPPLSLNSDLSAGNSSSSMSRLTKLASAASIPIANVLEPLLPLIK